MTISDVVMRYRIEKRLPNSSRPLPLRSLSDAIREQSGVYVSAQTLQNWAVNKFSPDADKLELISIKAQPDGWVRSFVADLRNALQPE